MLRIFAGCVMIVLGPAAALFAQPVGAQPLPAVHGSFYSLLQQGQYRAARERLEYARAMVEAARTADARENASHHYAVMFAREALETGNWDQAMQTPDGGGTADVAVWFARGVGAARAAGRGERPQLRDTARAAAQRLEEIASREGRYGAAEVARLGVLAAVAAAQDERDEMNLLLTHAASLDDLRPALDPLLDPLIMPLHELAGDLWLLVDRYAEARREYGLALQRVPGRARSVFGLARAAASDGDEQTARARFEQFLELWKDADAERPELRVAREHVHQ